MSIFPANVLCPYELIYVSGERKTKDLGLSTEKDPLGEGLLGFVHQSKHNLNIVIKKSITSLQEEQRIGLKLDHPNFMKVGRLFKKVYPASEEESAYTLYKLELEKIDGQTLNQILSNEKIGREFYLKLTASIVDAIVFLDRNEISWGDLNIENVMIDRSGQVRFIDYGFYEEESDTDKRVANLLNEYRNLMYTLADYKMHRDAKIINCHTRKCISTALKSLSGGQNSREVLNGVLAHINLYLNSL